MHKAEGWRNATRSELADSFSLHRSRPLRFYPCARQTTWATGLAVGIQSAGDCDGPLSIPASAPRPDGGPFRGGPTVLAGCALPMRLHLAEATAECRSPGDARHPAIWTQGLTRLPSSQPQCRSAMPTFLEWRMALSHCSANRASGGLGMSECSPGAPAIRYRRHRPTVGSLNRQAVC